MPVSTSLHAGMAKMLIQPTTKTTSPICLALTMAVAPILILSDSSKSSTRFANLTPLKPFILTDYCFVDHLECWRFQWQMEGVRRVAICLGHWVSALPCPYCFETQLKFALATLLASLGTEISRMAGIPKLCRTLSTSAITPRMTLAPARLKRAST